MRPSLLAVALLPSAALAWCDANCSKSNCLCAVRDCTTMFAGSKKHIPCSTDVPIGEFCDSGGNDEACFTRDDVNNCEVNGLGPELNDWYVVVDPAVGCAEKPPLLQACSVRTRGVHQ